MGPSGSGKSTCMNIMGCLDTPTEGTYLFRGVDVGTLSLNQRAILRRNYVGFVFQGFNLLARTSALENVELPLIYRGVSAGERHAQAHEALEAVGLGDRGHHYPVQLSGGEQQRVALARAVALRPPLLLADEPTGNLDTTTGAQIIELMLSLNRERGSTLLLVTHDPALTVHAERVIALRDGRIVDGAGAGAPEGEP